MVYSLNSANLRLTSKMRPIVLLDKSYFQGISANKVRELSASNELLMPDVLFFEHISSSEPGRTRCFSKLPTVDNPITLVKNVGSLLQKELRTRRPAGKPSDNRENLHFRFNSKLAEGSYTFDPPSQAALDESNEELKSDVSLLIEKMMLVPRFFPDLLKGNDKEREQEREAAEDFLAKEAEPIIEFLSQLEPPLGQKSLHSAAITPSWTLFRWFQVQMLLAIDLYVRYSGTIPQPLTDNLYKKLEHDVLDAQYLILGTLEGSFATRERKLIRIFELICPEGRLFS
jgi:hypothetical protein